MVDFNIKETIKQNQDRWRERSKNSDENVIAFAKRIVEVFGEMNLLSPRDVKQAKEMSDLDVVNKIISKVPRITPKQELEFGDRFVGDAELPFNIPPKFLALAYKSVRERAKKDDSQKARLEKLSSIIDEMANNFAKSGGLVIDEQNGFADGVVLNFVDMTNIADVYEGFKDMLLARIEDVNDSMRDVYNKNLKHLDEVIDDYDERWGLKNINESSISKMSDRYDVLTQVADQAQLRDDTYKLVSQTKFLDADGKVVPQFVNANGDKHEKWESGDRLDKDGRASAMLDFARLDYIKKKLGLVDEEIDAQEAEDEINQSMVEKLYELDVAQKILDGAKEDPEQFTDPKKAEDFVANLQRNGGVVSDEAYQAVCDKEVNGLAGWGARFKTKVSNFGTKVKNGVNKVGEFIGGLFNRVKKHDKLADSRTNAAATNKRQKRIEFFLRILKGFGCAFIASATITIIASAAAAMTGLGLAASLAIVGVMTSVIISAIQIHKWRKAQRENGLPDDLKTMLKDKRLVTSLGVSGLAAVAMIFGAAGMTTAAAVFGFGALTVGGTKNTIETYKDAKAAGFSTKASVAWGIANAAAVIVGAICGRMAGTAIVDAYNQGHPENTIFQNKETVETRTVEQHTDTETVYTQDALDHAKNVCQSWYRNDPDLLQARVDAINAYNVEHGTNIDPYRAIMINADAGGITPDNNLLHVQNGPDVYSGGHHKVFGELWAREYGVDKSIINDAAHLFNADGTVNVDGMNAVSHLEGYVSAHNEVGAISGLTDAKVVDGHSVQNDGVLKSNVIVDGEARHSVYADGAPAQETIVHNWDEEIINTHDVYTPITTPPVVATFGNYNQEDKSKDVAPFMGAQPDEIIERKKQEPEPVPEPPVEPVPPEKGPDDEIIIPGNGDEDIFVEGPDTGREAPEKIDEPIPVAPVQEPEPEPVPSVEETQGVFGMTIADADNYFKKQWQIEQDQMALQQNPKKSEADKIKTRLKTNKQDLNKMRNRLGNPSEEEINFAINEAWRRKDILALQDRIAHIESKWPEKTETQRDNKALEIAILQEDIEKLGGEKALDVSNLVFYKPVKGVQRVVEEEHGNPVRTHDEKGYEMSPENQSGVVAGPLQEKQDIDDERRATANQKKTPVAKQEENVVSRDALLKLYKEQENLIATQKQKVHEMELELELMKRTLESKSA